MSDRPARFDPANLRAITFDCYGTLIDWETGAIEALSPFLAGRGVRISGDELIAIFEDIETELIEPPYRSYRAILAAVVEGFGRRFGVPVGGDDRELVVRSLPGWKPFLDTVAALQALGRRYQLAIISNIDDDLFAATLRHLPVGFAHIVTAQQTGFYKPQIPIFREALRRLDLDGGAVLHAAEGAGEVSPARRLGCRTAWVRRHGRSRRFLTETPDLEVPDLKSLLEILSADDRDG